MLRGKFEIRIRCAPSAAHIFSRSDNAALMTDGSGIVPDVVAGNERDAEIDVLVSIFAAAREALVEPAEFFENATPHR